MNRQTRRDFLKSTGQVLSSIGAFAALSGCFNGGRDALSRRRPNILLITADDLGVQLGCYGDPCARTVNMDKLAQKGVRFEHGFVTQASCSPSRSSIFTGLYPHQNGQIGLAHRGYSMKQGLPTLPKLLGQAGYRTGVFGKIHVEPRSDLPWDVSQADKIDLVQRDVRIVAKRAGNFIADSVSRARPFFAMVNFIDPHRPFEGHIKEIPANPQGPADIRPFPFLGLDTAQLRTEVAGYYNCVERVDVGVGLLLAELERAGQARNTLVIVIGDHGPPFTRSKTTCYEAGLHIPFLVYWPGHSKAGLVRREMVSTVDILPTICAAAGVKPPDNLAGRSFCELMRGEDVSWRQTLCAEYTSHHQGAYFPRRSIRDRRHKLILNLLTDRPNPVRGVDGCSAWQASRDCALEGTDVRKAYDTYHRPPAIELYDLQEDPHEFHNLAGEPDHYGIQQILLAKLLLWRQQTNDPLLDAEKLAELTRRHDAIESNPKRKNKRKPETK